MKQVTQLDAAGYFIGLTVADKSPLEPGVFLLPAGAIDQPAPTVPSGQRARWQSDGWVFEPVPQAASESDALPAPQLSAAEALQQWRASYSITMRQCRLHLLAEGKLGAVQAAIDALPEPQASAAKIEWEYSATVQRLSPLIAQFCPALGWDDPETIDSHFVIAGQL
jgi:hypothetical protein